jgi:hypothetical protein
VMSSKWRETKAPAARRFTCHLSLVTSKINLPP